MGIKKAPTKKKDSPELRAAKLEVEKVELKEKLKKQESEKYALAFSILMIMFGAAIFTITGI